MFLLGHKLWRWNERDCRLVRSVGDPTVFASIIARCLKQGMLNFTHLSYVIIVGLLSWSAMRHQPSDVCAYVLLVNCGPYMI